MSTASTARQKLGIVIPAHNAAATIGDTLKSIRECRQLDRISGVYVCDDASSDGTSEVVRRAWNGITPLFVWRNDVNLGERATLNRAFERLKTELDWVYLIHADDLAKPNWIQLYLERISRCGPRVVSVSSSWDTWFPEKDTIVPGEDDLSRDFQVITGTRDAVVGTLDRGCWWRISGCVIHLQKFFECGDFRPDLPVVGDLEWSLRALKNGYSIEFIPRTSVLYRQHATSISTESSRTAKDLYELMFLYKTYYDDGYLSSSKWRAFRLNMARLVSKRIVRGIIRQDLKGVRGCLNVLTTAVYPGRIAETVIY